jgi:hypothetical protein
MKQFEVKNTDVSTTKRLIIYESNDQETSVGYKVNKQELYQLYTVLKEMFKDL